jgi:hypothetical protein
MDEDSGRARSFIIARNKVRIKRRYRWRMETEKMDGTNKQPWPASRVPCGTPAGTLSQSVIVVVYFTLRHLFLRKSMIQLTTLGFTPRLNNLATNKL